MVRVVKLAFGRIRSLAARPEACWRPAESLRWCGRFFGEPSSLFLRRESVAERRFLPYDLEDEIEFGGLQASAVQSLQANSRGRRRRRESPAWRPWDRNRDWESELAWPGCHRATADTQTHFLQGERFHDVLPVGILLAGGNFDFGVPEAGRHVLPDMVTLDLTPIVGVVVIVVALQLDHPAGAGGSCVGEQLRFEFLFRRRCLFVVGDPSPVAHLFLVALLTSSVHHSARSS